MATIAPADIFAYLVQKHGVSSAMAAGICVNIQFESSFSTTAVGDNGTSGGLFQHHLGRWDSLKKYAASTGRSWDDWTAQVDFAMQEARSMGIDLQTNDPVQAAKQWTIKFERPADMYRKADMRAAQVSKYTALDPNGTYSTTGGGTVGDGNATVDASQEAVSIPTGGTWYRHPDGGWAVAYPVVHAGSTGRNHPVVWYRSSTAPPAGTRIYGSSGFADASPAWVDGGDVGAFRGVPAGTTYQKLLNDTLFELGLMGSEALNDKGVMAVVAVAMTRDMSPAEISNRLRQTAYWQARTDKEREWDDLSEAEKDQRMTEAASQLSSSWFTYVGEDLDLMSYDSDGDGQVSAQEIQKGNPELYSWANRVASGKASVVEAVNTWMKDEASQNPESPWSRTIRDEEKAQGAHASEVAQMKQQLETLYQEWGVPLSRLESSKDVLAEDLVMNRLAWKRIEDDVKRQANGLYANKPENVKTVDYAAPFMTTYENLLETGPTDLYDNHIQAALTQGMNLGEFRDLLRKDDRWLETDNARADMNEKISQLGRQFGFS